MKKIEIKFNKNNAKKYAAYLVEHRKAFFAVFCGALFIFVSSVIYENAYYNIEQIDYAKSGSFEDDEIRREIMFEKVVENIELREQTIRNVRNKEYKNPFSFNDEEIFDEEHTPSPPPRENGARQEGNNGGEENNDGGDDDLIVPLADPISRTH